MPYISTRVKPKKLRLLSLSLSLFLTVLSLTPAIHRFCSCAKPHRPLRPLPADTSAAGRHCVSLRLPPHLVADFCVQGGSELATLPGTEVVPVQGRASTRGCVRVRVREHLLASLRRLTIDQLTGSTPIKV